MWFIVIISYIILNWADKAAYFLQFNYFDTADNSNLRSCVLRVLVEFEIKKKLTNN